MTSIREVRAYWEKHPLYSFEVEGSKKGDPEYFKTIDRFKRENIERFAFDYWAFKSFAGKEVLDDGCGPGWLTVNYAKSGANVTAIDLTSQAVRLTRQYLDLEGLSAKVYQASAEALPFPDNTFDLVVSSGVLHHTEDTLKAFLEAARVLRPGGEAKITLYHKGILHRPVIFPFVRFVMKALSVRHPGADMARNARSVDDFIRMYDGSDNPIGRGNTTNGWRHLLRKSGFRPYAWELHFFPKRFLPFHNLVPTFLHRWLDQTMGTMIYFSCRKPARL
ncbi:MAG: class I SAM-dependent methyltransferase [Planctomycetota bacterium]|nr:MAG: class I SAM-dependent methyltransferase [Planctomycetota bacterium]